MQTVKVIVQPDIECYECVFNLEEVFLTIFLSENSELTELKIDSRICVNDQFQDSLSSVKGVSNGTSEE